MVNTGWKKALDKCGRSQRSTAQALSVNIAELSMVVQGRAFLTPEKFDRACELLDCRPTDLYEADVLSLMYGKAGKPKRRRGTRVELDEDMDNMVTAWAEQNDTTKTKMVNSILRFVRSNQDMWP